MARFGWLRRRDTTKAAPTGATMVPLADVLTALQQPGHAAAASKPMDRPDEWRTLPFNPGNPLYPSPVNPARPDTGRPEPRVFELSPSWNLKTSIGRLIPWQTLRDAADMPIIRQCIDARQRNLTGLDWDITISQDAVNDLKKTGASTADATDQLRKRLAPQIDRLVAFWRRPDPQQGLNFTAWLWQLMEEQLVLDAVAIYPRYTYGGDLLGLRGIDASTIKPLLNAEGARPEPPHPAYQQILYGFPRGEFNAEVDPDGSVKPGMSADQLIYQRRTVRTWTPYGLSPVERALIDIDLYLKRHGWMRAEYDDGVAPELVLKILSGEWTPRRLKEYERAFNDDLSGQTAERLRARMLPPGTEPATLPSIPERYRPEYDLHLIKLVASHFGVPVTELGFSEAKGLGSSGWSEGQESVNYRAGTLPDARWWGALFTEIGRIHLGAPRELEFRFLGLDEEDEKDADAIADSRVKSGRMTYNEDRDRLGLPRYPFPEADMPAIATGRGMVFLEGAAESAQPGQMLEPGAPARQNTPAEQPGNETSPRDGGGGDGEGGGERADAAKAQLAAFRRWARKRSTDPRRPFEFTADRDLLVKLAPDLADDDRVTFKAADADPKDAADWPGWEQDEALVDHYADALADALADAIDCHRLAEDWLTTRGVHKSAAPAEPPDPGAVQDARQWAETAGVFARLSASLRRVLGDAWTEAWLLGHRAALAVVTHARVDWGGWTPGNPRAARKLIGGAPGLQSLLDHYGITTIRSVASTRMDELAATLAGALRDGSSVDELTRDLRDVLSRPERARMVAHTEIARAQSAASMDTYQDRGVDRVEWLIAPTDACPICVGNADEGPIRRGQDFAGGVDAPPQHPNCRCAITPASILDKAGGADRNRGNAENLRRWYVRGEGAAQIDWGTPGDFERCVAIAGRHVADPEGYCANRHKEATGKWPGREHH